MKTNTDKCTIKPQELKEIWPIYHGAFKNIKLNILNGIIEYNKIDTLINNEKQIPISDRDVAIRIGASGGNDISPNEIKSDLDLYFLRAVVMESLIIDMGKILGATNSDQTGLKKLKRKLKDQKFRPVLKEIEDFEDKYKQEIIKIEKKSKQTDCTFRNLRKKSIF